MSDSEESLERRRHERKKLDVTRGGVTFSVEIDGDQCEIQNVHDVSISGIRLGVNHEVKVGHSVVLTAQEDEFVISVNGEIRWSTPSEEIDGYDAGVEFDSSDVDNNILFFMSLRKYLDSFDDVPVKEL